MARLELLLLPYEPHEGLVLDRDSHGRHRAEEGEVRLDGRRVRMVRGQPAHADGEVGGAHLVSSRGVR